MTLEQTTERILAAADLQDLDALRVATELREQAIAALASAIPCAELCNQLTESIAAGERAKLAVRVVKRRLRSESRRLAQIEAGFVSALRPPVTHQVDCEG